MKFVWLYVIDEGKATRMVQEPLMEMHGVTLKGKVTLTLFIISFISFFFIDTNH